MTKRRVVITGMGVVTPLSCDVNDLWQRVVAGESGIHHLQAVDTDRLKVTIGGDMQNWDPSEYIPPKHIKRFDRFTQFAIVAGSKAVEDSGIDFSKEDSFRCGVIVGSGIGGLNEMEEQILRLVELGPGRVSPLTIPKLIVNAAGSQLSIQFGLRGPNYAVATACASAANAMGDAFRTIQEGGAEVMITGGTEAALTRMSLSGFANMKALSVRNDDPQRASRPFDAGRDGFVMSEGAGILVFEEYEHAKARGAKIYAELRGYGTCGDGNHITHPHEDGSSAAESMKLALFDAQIEPEDVTYINAHGTGTPLGDRAETQAIKQVFQDHAKEVSISSTKSELGHALGASGGIEMIISVMALQDQVVPPTINLDTPDPECDLDFTPNQPRERKLKAVMSNSFGFGGHNASIIISHHDRKAA